MREKDARAHVKKAYKSAKMEDVTQKFPNFRGAPTTRDPNTSAEESRNGRRIVIQVGGVYASFCQREGSEGILLEKYRDKNRRCIAMLSQNIGAKGRFDSPDNTGNVCQFLFTQYVFTTLRHLLRECDRRIHHLACDHQHDSWRFVFAVLPGTLPGSTTSLGGAQSDLEGCQHASLGSTLEGPHELD